MGEKGQYPDLVPKPKPKLRQDKAGLHCLRVTIHSSLAENVYYPCHTHPCPAAFFMYC